MKRIVATWVFVCALAIAALAGRTQAQGPPASIGSQSVRTTPAGSFIEDEVLIQFRAGASEADKADARGWVNGRRKKLLRRDNQGELEVATVPSGIPVENAIALLSRHPTVRVAEPNWVYTHAATSDDPYYVLGSLWGMYGPTTSPSNQYGSQAGAAWAAGQTGSRSVLVGVIDEGIDVNHPDLAANIWTNPFDPPDGVDNDGNGYIDDIHGWDFYNDDNTTFDGSRKGGDKDSHGTHVSGTIGASGGNGIGVAGVNWNVTIISSKFLGPLGGVLSDAIQAIDYVTDLKIRHGLNIVATNNSWSGGGYSQSLHEALIRSANAGILFIAAAGNFGNNNDTAIVYPANLNTLVGTSGMAPASYDAVISVAAIDSSGAKASFSDYGATTVDLGAPGVDVISTTPDNTYTSYSGTSMATPHVTGAAALYAAMHPGVLAADIKAAILSSAQNTPTASLAGLTVTGGRLNVSRWIPPAAPSGPGATPVSSSLINLSWTDNSNDEDGFTIERCQGAGCANFGQIASLGAGATFYADAGLAAGTTYRYRVRAFKAGGPYSAYTGPAQATTLSASPSLITLSASGTSMKGTKSTQLLWSPFVAGSYDIYRNNVKIMTIAAKSGNYTDNLGAAPSGTYVYRVCTAGTSTCSNDATVIF
jgi:subtilisin family serine protease